MDVNSLNTANQNYAQPVQTPREVPAASLPTAPAEPLQLPRMKQKAEAKFKRPEDADHIGERAINDMMNKAISEANKRLMPVRSELSYSVHEVTRDIMVVVKNSDTGDIIREIPPEKTLDAIARVWELIGILVDETR